MKFFHRLETKYRRFAIPGLMNYIIALYVLGLIIMLQRPDFYYRTLSLDAEAILRGEVWRVLTFMVYPPSEGIFALLILYMYYMLGNTLERMWGAFRFNVYFFMGIIGHVAAAMIGHLVFGERWILTTTYLNFSLFFAYAMTFPEAYFYIFMVFPIKAKVLGGIEALLYVYLFFAGGARTKCEIAVSMLNVIFFFLLTRNYNQLNFKEIQRKRKFKAKTKAAPQSRTHHKCAVCGKTEQDGDHLEFRYCSKCDGAYEYCSDHLYTHKHVVHEDK